MLIRITRGTYGYKPQGAQIITPIHAGECVEVSAEKADELIGKGIAEAVSEEQPEEVCDSTAAETPDPSPEEAGSEAEEAEEAEETEEDLSALKVAELRKIDEERGIAVNGLRTKAELIEAIRSDSGPDLSAVGDVIG